ncbi:MAG: biotin/lipoyl-containing protein [Terracidiphilus sp.]
MKLQIKVDGKTYEVEVEILDDGVEPPVPEFAQYQPAPASFPGALAPLPGEQSGDDPKICRSPVTGLVIRVNVEPGQSVEANDLLMVLESMKMETNVTAANAATVKSIHVGAGDSVKLNQVIVEFE